MKKIGKMRLRLCALALALCLLAAGSIPAFAEEEKRQVAMSFTAKSVLLMEQQTGQLLFEQNAREALAPASLLPPGCCQNLPRPHSGRFPIR